MTFTEAGRDAVPRTEDGRPLIIPPEGGDAVPYGQPSALGGVLMDTENLQKWRERHILEGLRMDSGLHPVAGLNAPFNDLLVEIDRAHGDRALLNGIADEAFERSGGTGGRDYGTKFHNITEIHDKGMRFKGPLGLSYQMQLDFDAYVKLIGRMKFEAIEAFVVNDEIKHAGSPDRINTCVCDTKTGKNIYNQQVEIAVQLATYNHAQYYNPKTGERKAIGCRTDIAYVFWVTGGVAKLVEVDTRRGWEMAKLAYRVLEAREQEDTGLFKTVRNTEAARRANIERWLASEILLYASTVDEIDELWRKNKKHWTPTLTLYATDRVVRLGGRK